MARATTKNVDHITDNVTNGADEPISFSEPYSVTVRLRGTAPLLFHAWNAEAVEAKGKAAKGSEAKKTDNVESYVYRDDEGNICVPAVYIRGAVIQAAKFKQDPRSPRKSAMDLFKAAVVPLVTLASLGTKQWDYLDKQRVVVQRNSINRTRPAMKEGWEVEAKFGITLPEYIDQDLFNEVLVLAGKIGGIGDFRPTYGRFTVTRFETGTY